MRLIAGLMPCHITAGDDRATVYKAVECTLVTINLCADVAVGDGPLKAMSWQSADGYDVFMVL
jgi:hypothetical protein